MLLTVTKTRVSVKNKLLEDTGKDENIVMQDLESREDILWGFLLFSGYFTAVEQLDDEVCRLQIPNSEVLLNYRQWGRFEQRQYAAELEGAGIRNILKLAMAFQGKQLWLRQG